MGGCFSKKNDSSSSPSSLTVTNGRSSSSVKPPNPSTPTNKTQKSEIEQQKKIKNRTVQKSEEEEKPRKGKEEGGEKGEEDQGKVKKELFIIKHRKSHDKPKTTDLTDSSASAEEKSSEDSNNMNPNVVVRTSSCTKEELDAILIQCGRLSRSNSSGAKIRKYSGSKRSFDFDQNEKSSDGDANITADLEDGEESRGLHRQRPRQSGRDRASSSPRERRRRAPSREREESKNRSGSIERGSGGSSSRRVSKSPGRRSETNPNSGGGDGNVDLGNNRSGNSGGGNNVNSSNRPGKMVSVPATDKTSLVMDKSNKSAEPLTKRITVKRNVAAEGSRSAASPRPQSPARASSQPPSLSRRSSRKAEQSPYTRNPLGEIDPNSLAYPQSNGNMVGSACGNSNKKISRENEGQGLIKDSSDFLGQKPNSGMNSNSNRMAPQATNCRAASPKRFNKEQREVAENCKITASSTECLKPQALTRSRSLRKSRDFHLNPEVLLNNNNPTPSYTALLLEDIQNFHHKTINIPSSFTLPPSVTKACSILEAVADLNSTTNTSPVPDHSQRNEYNNLSSCAKTVMVKDDLMEPSFEKYVTVKRGGSLEDMEEQESSSGSNSFTQQWGVSSSSWEPNSADSTDRWSSRSKNTSERDKSPLGFQRNDGNGQKRLFDPLQNGIGRGRVGSGKGLPTTPHIVAAAASM